MSTHKDKGVSPELTTLRTGYTGTRGLHGLGNWVRAALTLQECELMVPLSKGWARSGR